MKRAAKVVLVLVTGVGIGVLAGCRPGDAGWDTLHNLGNRIGGDEDREHEREVFHAWRTDASLPRGEGVPLVIK